MKHRIPKHYTILISCTGKDPIVLAFRPALAIFAALIAVSIPVAWVARIVHSYALANSQLVERNSVLSQEASKILNRVEALEAEIDGLQERAGMTREELQRGDRSSSRSQGGVSRIVDAMTLLQAASSQMSGLITNLKGEVQPALEKTLERESARPRGIPLKGSFGTSSDFGLRRNPFGSGYEFHEGLDFISAYGAPIYATAPGTVNIASWTGGYGNLVEIDHGYGYKTRYAHLSKVVISKGAKVERGQVIGHLGNTGRSSGPHLHYGVYQDQLAVDPKFYLDD